MVYRIAILCHRQEGHTVWAVGSRKHNCGTTFLASWVCCLQDRATAAAASTASGQAWRAQAAALRRDMHAPLDLKPWSSLPAKFEGLTPTPRILEILDLAAIARLGTQECQRILRLPAERALAEMSRQLADVYVDVSQNPGRKCWSSQDLTAKCLTTASRLCCFRGQGLILPLELLYFQGHSRSVAVPHDMPQSSIRDLAGEGICLPVLGSILTSLLLCGAFPSVVPCPTAASRSL